MFISVKRTKTGKALNFLYDDIVFNVSSAKIITVFDGFTGFICRERRPRRPASLILRWFTRRDVGDAVPYTMIAPYTAFIRHLFVVLTLFYYTTKRMLHTITFMIIFFIFLMNFSGIALTPPSGAVFVGWLTGLFK